MNYSIEGNIDFYKELLESVCETTLDDKKNEKQEEDLCLITQQPLEEHFIILDCKHLSKNTWLINDRFMLVTHFYCVKSND